MGKNNVSRDARTTPQVRISYPALFVPRKVDQNSKPKYSVTLMFDKNNKEHIDFLKAIYTDCESAMTEHWPDPATRPTIPITGHIKSPIKDGDATVNNSGLVLSAKNPEYAGHYIIRANTSEEYPPAVIDKVHNKIMDKGAVYGGCFIMASINAYTYQTPMSAGVTIGLNAVMKVADGESFGGSRPSVEEMFGVPTGTGDPNNYQQTFGGQSAKPAADLGGQPNQQRTFGNPLDGGFSDDDELPF